MKSTLDAASTMNSRYVDTGIREQPTFPRFRVALKLLISQQEMSSMLPVPAPSGRCSYDEFPDHVSRAWRVLP